MDEVALMPARKDDCTPQGQVELREYLEAKIEAIDKSSQARIEGVERSIEAARRDMDRRLEDMNQFRAQLTKQAGEFVNKEAYEPRHEAIQKQVNELREFRAVTEGKASYMSVFVTLAIAVMGLVIGVIGLAVNLGLGKK